MKNQFFSRMSRLILACSLFLLPGCAGDSNDDKPEHLPEVFTVEIKDMKFVPEQIEVNKGDTVVWINRDIVAHDATSLDDPPAWGSPALQAGQSWKMELKESADYYCSLHVVMRGKVVVKN